MFELTEKEKYECLQAARRELGLAPSIPPGWCEIQHPTSWGDVAVVTEQSYLEVWRHKGWTLVPRID